MRAVSKLSKLVRLLFSFRDSIGYDCFMSKHCSMGVLGGHRMKCVSA